MHDNMFVKVMTLMAVKSIATEVLGCRWRPKGAAAGRPDFKPLGITTSTTQAEVFMWTVLTRWDVCSLNCAV